MSSHYNSFLLRCWHIGTGGLRIKIEHVQSGEHTQVTTPGEAIDWMSAHWSQPSGDCHTTLEQPSFVEDDTAPRE